MSITHALVCFDGLVASCWVGHVALNVSVDVRCVSHGPSLVLLTLLIILVKSLVVAVIKVGYKTVINLE
ncbi:hypothetical protein BDZ85DRAFT_264559 [Elsinoe ampelina]|uniref:Uncharacterized protein n=1 Tax=Elsinoe ampelina TaxID=302913 RepID=A0A6A6G8K1_9PEZI|nr:hypothetical protein BDZ85DRAFT_264559 [Elsinoe ampelina]